MIEIFSKNVAFKLKALAIYQLVFGLLGLAVTLWVLVNTTFNSKFLILLFLVPAALYTYSLYCGVLLFQKKDAALKHSAVNQYVQLISFSILGYAFQYSAGALITVGIDITHDSILTFNFGAISTWNIQIATQSNLIIVNFNLVACALIIFIGRLKKRIAMEQEMQVMAIGEGVGSINVNG